ncbi:MAG: DUF1501 domain-containing protein [Verrucomicrobia bacterium]|nr:DUF1501 domain-containing protein [Verrucomicrobiota bacterium]
MQDSSPHSFVSIPLSSLASLSRRTFLQRSAAGIGLAALHSLVGESRGALPNHTPRAKRVIYLFQSGAPSQMDLFDYKPRLQKFRAQELPDSIRMGQRITTMTSGQKSFPVAPSIFKFAQHGNSGAWLSELLPHTAEIVDDLAFIKTMHTEAINHDPAITFFQTGSQIAGRPSIGSWMAYGLGSENRDLPAYVVLTSKGTGRRDDQPLYDRLWGSGFLPTQHQGVKFRNAGDPVLYLSNPPGVDRETTREMLDDVNALNRIQHEAVGDPEIAARIAQYEMAFRMQASVPELTDISKEPQPILDLYGPEVRTPGTYAATCLLARRLAERGVRFIQLFHMGWDHHANLPKALRGQCRDTDQPTAGLIADLKQRGLLEDTLVVWGGEFGRTVYTQGTLTPENYGRDHHPRCFTIWMAGAGVRGGVSLGETDDYCYNIVRDPVHVHDLHATILHLMGVDHLKLTYKFQGRWFRLTDVAGNIITPIIA